MGMRLIVAPKKDLTLKGMKVQMQQAKPFFTHSAIGPHVWYILLHLDAFGLFFMVNIPLHGNYVVQFSRCFIQCLTTNINRTISHLDLFIPQHFTSNTLSKKLFYFHLETLGRLFTQFDVAHPVSNGMGSKTWSFHAKTQADRSSDLDLAGISQSVENVRRQNLPLRVGLCDLRWLFLQGFKGMPVD